MNRIPWLNHAPVSFLFNQNARDFVVDEIPLYDFSGEGEHLVLRIRKKGLSTQEMLKILTQYIGIKQRDIGYAGLKDKQAMTTQYISLHRNYEQALQDFSHPAIKILETHLHNNKLRIGHLKGNRFFVRLKKVNPTDAQKIQNIYQHVANAGFPNFFGYQRFGRDGDNAVAGKELVAKKTKGRQSKFLLSAYQSDLFNRWLNKRIEMSKIIDSFSTDEIKSALDLPLDVIKEVKQQKSFFKLLPGDLMHHYPYGKVFELESMEESCRFDQKEIVPTGLLPGNKVKRAGGLAGRIEASFDDENLKEPGSRRFAWVYPEACECRYKEEDAWCELNFTLPKGSYATVLIEQIAAREIQ